MSSTLQEFQFPTRKNEAWHYTSLKEISSKQFEFAGTTTPLVASQLSLLNPEFLNLVFVDGFLNKQLSDWNEASKALVIDEDTFEKGTSSAENVSELLPLEGFNKAHLQKGLSLKVLKNTSVQKPVHILSVLTQSHKMAQPFLSVNLEEGSKLSLIESYSSLSSESWQNSVAKISVGRSAKLEYLRLQEEHKASYNTGLSRIELAEGAQLESLSFTVGARLGRHDLMVSLLGKEAYARVQGLTLASGEQHLDHNTVIDHRVGHCVTSQLYKSVLNEKSRSVFTGMVKIQQGAQKASSEQLNNNLLLSRDAEADSRPQLEILADDVKATHGSTVGQLNPEELFYLLSRAIPREQALEMLSLGFVQDLVFQVSDVRVQAWLSQILLKNYRSSNLKISGAAL